MDVIRQKFILVCTPTLGTVSIDWAGSLRGLVWPSNYGFGNVFTVDEVGDQVAETRNRCVQRAMEFENQEREVSHLFWLDDDVFASRFVVPQLLSHARPIVSGAYFLKREVSEPLIYPGPGAGTTPFVPEKFFETWGVGMGLCLVELGVYRKMQADLDLGLDGNGRPAWYRTLGPGHLDRCADGFVRELSTEDLFFCDNARRLGVSVHVDTSRHAFGWHYCRRRKTAFPEKQWKQAISGQSIVWPTPEGDVFWTQ